MRKQIGQEEKQGDGIDNEKNRRDYPRMFNEEDLGPPFVRCRHRLLGTLPPLILCGLVGVSSGYSNIKLVKFLRPCRRSPTAGLPHWIRPLFGMNPLGATPEGIDFGG